MAGTQCTYAVNNVIKRYGKRVKVIKCEYIHTFSIIDCLKNCTQFSRRGWEENGEKKETSQKKLQWAQKP